MLNTTTFNIYILTKNLAFLGVICQEPRDFGYFSFLLITLFRSKTFIDKPGNYICTTSQ